MKLRREPRPEAEDKLSQLARRIAKLAASNDAFLDDPKFAGLEREYASQFRAVSSLSL